MNGNIIRPAFGKKASVEKVPEPDPKSDYILPDPDAPPLEGEALERAQRDLLFALANMEYVRSTRDLITEIGDYIFSLKGFSPHGDNIKLRRQGLQSSSLEDLCAQARNSSEQQWAAKPSFFGALTLEHHYRVQSALSLLPKE